MLLNMKYKSVLSSLIHGAISLPDLTLYGQRQNLSSEVPQQHRLRTVYASLQWIIAFITCLLKSIISKLAISEILLI